MWAQGRLSAVLVAVPRKRATASSNLIHSARAGGFAPKESIMLDPKQLDDLVQRFAANMPKGLQVLQEDINRNVKASLESGLSRLDLVTREEFDVQSAVLARTREKVVALEAQVAALEQALGARQSNAD